jgi:hypothetical protein
MKKFLPLAFLFLLFGFIKFAQAQTPSNNQPSQAIHIAIIPFTSPMAPSPEVSQATDLIEKEVTGAFGNKDRFYLLDRNQTEKIKRELDRSSDKASIYSSVMAEKGHLGQAEYIITGVMNSYVIGSDQTYYNYKYITQYHASLRLSLQIVKVETGRTIFSDPIIIKSIDFATASPGDIADNVLCKLKEKMKGIVRNLFPPDLMILHVQKEKKGLPYQVLINGGSELFDNGKDKTSCDIDERNVYQKAGKGLASMFRSGKTKLDVFLNDNFTANGKTYSQTSLLGTMLIDEVQGEDLSLCEITSGADKIKEAMDGNKTVIVKLHAEEESN